MKTQHGKKDLFTEIIDYHESRKDTCLSTTHILSIDEFSSHSIFDRLKIFYPKFIIEIDNNDVKLTIFSKK